SCRVFSNVSHRRRTQMGLFTEKEKEYLHIKVNPNAAFVVDDLVTDPSWTPRGVTIKGTVRIHESRGEALGPGFGPRWIELIPHWVSSWGIDADPFAAPTAPRKLADADR